MNTPFWLLVLSKSTAEAFCQIRKSFRQLRQYYLYIQQPVNPTAADDPRNSKNPRKPRVSHARGAASIARGPPVL